MRTLSEDECDDCGEYNEGFDNFIYNSPNIDTLSNGVWASFSLSHMSSSIQLIDCGGEEVIDQIYYEHDPNGDSQWEEDEELDNETVDEVDDETEVEAEDETEVTAELEDQQ